MLTEARNAIWVGSRKKKKRLPVSMFAGVAAIGTVTGGGGCQWLTHGADFLRCRHLRSD